MLKTFPAVLFGGKTASPNVDYGQPNLSFRGYPYLHVIGAWIKDLRRHGHQEAFLAAVRAPNQLAVGWEVNAIFELLIENNFNCMYLNGPRWPCSLVSYSRFRLPETDFGDLVWWFRLTNQSFLCDFWGSGWLKNRAFVFAQRTNVFPHVWLVWLHRQVKELFSHGGVQLVIIPATTPADIERMLKGSMRSYCKLVVSSAYLLSFCVFHQSAERQRHES